MIESGRLLVLYGSQTFTAQEAAERIWRTTKALGFRGPVQAMDDYPISKLIHEEFAVFVCATTGQGDEPDNMKKFWKFLLRKSLPSNSLAKLKFGVIALGDSSYSKFNFVGKKLNKRLLQLGATPLLDVGLCDYQHDLGHDAVMQPWLKDFYSRLQIHFPSIKLDKTSSFIPRWSVTLLKNNDLPQEKTEDIYFGHGCKDLFNDATQLEVESNLRTTDENHFQDVRLIALKTIGESVQSFTNYQPGDVFNIRPRNSREDIADLFGIFKSHNLDIKPQYRLLVGELHEDMPVPPFLQQRPTLYEIAEQYWDLRACPTQYVFSLLALVSDDELEREKCSELGTSEGQEDWLNYCRRPRRTIIEVLQDFHKSASKLTIEVLFELFTTIKPRSFSIASSSLHTKSLEILVAVVQYHTKLKKARLGLCSNWLKGLRIGDRVYGWIKKGTLIFPDATVPHILIGPGTGLAPFRSLLQTRVSEGTAVSETLHLFIGCRFKEKDYHCGEELETMAREGKITLYCAFSRDQENKIYVQHKISEHSQALWDLISNGAYIFISGNAKNMPDNVRDAFIEDVICKVGGRTIEESRTYLKSMENRGLLQVETW